MPAADLKARTKRFALDMIRFSTRLPGRPELVIIRNLVRAATSVGANYRSACRAQSAAHFISKLSIVEEEAAEAMYWLELLSELGFGSDPELVRLLDEASQLVSIIVASRRTARS